MGLTSISLYSGVGGLDFGFEAAGFTTTATLDLDPVACRTLRLNRRWPVIEGNVADVPSEKLLQIASLSVGEADVLIGGPPCQPFSKSGYWVNGDSARLTDPRADTLFQYFRILEDTRPRAFLLENVPGLAFQRKKEAIEHIEKCIANINRNTGYNYSLSYRILNAADYGVPQSRERLFIVGARDGKVFSFPKPTYASRNILVGSIQLPPHRTAWDAIGDLQHAPSIPELQLSGKWADLLPSIPEGRNYLWHTERGGGQPLFGWRRRYWNFLLKLAKDQPSWTIQAQPGPATGPFHWGNRKLSVVELGRLQTLPDGLAFDCGYADAQRMIGNAVPSGLAEMLALEIRRQLLGISRREAGPSLIPTERNNVPPAERVIAVPPKYLRFAGHHSAHPGTGKGNRALARSSRAA